MIAASLSTVRIAPETADEPLRQVLRVVGTTLPDAYLVGGAVRDLLRGAQPYDVDITVAGDASLAAARLADKLGGHSFAMDDERGQHRIVLSANSAVTRVDVSSRGPDVLADLQRRDFTVNALAAPLLPDGSLGEIIDCCGGLQDVQARCLRMVSDANLSDDPLRLLRAVRLAVELQFAIEPATRAAISRLAPRLAETAAERIREEVVRIMATPRAAVGLRLLDELRLLGPVIPELLDGKGVAQPAQHHYYDVFDHAIEAVAALDDMLHPEAPSRRPWLRQSFSRALGDFALDEYLQARQGGVTRLVLLKLAALLHDVAKPETKALQPDGRIRFFGHSEAGSTKAARILKRLRFGGKEVRFVSLLVAEHLRPGMLSQGNVLPTRRAIFRFYRDLEDAAPACLILSLADAAAAAGPRLDPARWQGYCNYIGFVLQQGDTLQQEQAARPRLLSGDDLMMALSIPPGPLVGRLLRQIEEAAAAGEVSSREQALDLAAALKRSQEEARP